MTGSPSTSSSPLPRPARDDAVLCAVRAWPSSCCYGILRVRSALSRLTSALRLLPGAARWGLRGFRRLCSPSAVPRCGFPRSSTPACCYKTASST
eukprot:2833632-Rhodomonas_salina.3